MPTFIKPKYAIIEPGGGEFPFALAAAAAAVVAAVVCVAHLIVEWFAAIMTGVGVLAVAGIATVTYVLLRDGVRLWRPETAARLPASRTASYSITASQSPAKPVQAGTEPLSIEQSDVRGIPPVVHNHLHLDGVTADQLAAVIRAVGRGQIEVER